MGGESKATEEARPYHHGDLRRALINAARQLLETEGPAALSLRAVAREAGVSPAAPYHHFKDKSELLAAVAEEGWAMLSEALSAAFEAAGPEADKLLATPTAYVQFARQHPALYRVMFESSRHEELLPLHDTNRAMYRRVGDVLTKRGLALDEVNLELAILAAWCASHGVSEMVGFRQFEHLKTRLGGERALIEALLRHMGLYSAVAAGCEP